MYYILPPLRAAAVLSFLFLGLFYAPIFVVPKWKRATYLFATFALLFTLVILVWDRPDVLLSPLAAWSTVRHLRSVLACNA